MSRFMDLFNAFSAGVAANKDAKKARLIQRSLVDQRINAAGDNGTLFDSLHSASFLTEKQGQLVYRFKLDSLFDRFGQGVSFPSGSDVQKEFGKLFMKSLTHFCATWVKQTFDTLKEAGVDVPAFDPRETEDAKLALAIVADMKKFGTAIHTPKPILVESTRFNVCKKLADELAAEILAEMKNS